MEIKNKYNMTKNENIFVAKRNIVDYIWKSANLEEIAVTYPQTEVLYEGLSVDELKIKDIDTIANQIMIQNGVGIISIPLKDQEQFRNLLII